MVFEQPVLELSNFVVQFAKELVMTVNILPVVLETYLRLAVVGVGPLTEPMMVVVLDTPEIVGQDELIVTVLELRVALLAPVVFG